MAWKTKRCSTSTVAECHLWVFCCCSVTLSTRFVLTFPLAQRQVGVVQRVVVQLRFRLLLWLSELGEVRQSEGLCGRGPALGVQQQHALQHRHGWGTRTKVESKAADGPKIPLKDSSAEHPTLGVCCGKHFLEVFLLKFWKTFDVASRLQIHLEQIKQQSLPVPFWWFFKNSHPQNPVWQQILELAFLWSSWSHLIDPSLNAQGSRVTCDLTFAEHNNTCNIHKHYFC